MPCPFYRPGQQPLVLGAEPSHPSGQDLPPFGHERFKEIDILVVNLQSQVHTKSATLTAMSKLHSAIILRKVMPVNTPILNC